MNVNYFSSIQQEKFNNDAIANNEDTFNEDLHDPNLTVSAMIKKYDVSMLDNKESEQKKKEKKDLQCTICGARAFGYNFDQITCESCKAFFRRNARRNMVELKCRFSGNCNITVENRRQCTHCRIKKCFDVGMRKEWIRSEEENNMKRIQSGVNRRIKQTKRPLQMPIVTQTGNFNSIRILSATDRMRLNNVTHCYDQYTGEPTIRSYFPPKEILFLRVHDFYNRKKTVIINFINYFKHLPEFQQLHVDDQVLLIKQNIHSLLPINYALLKTPINSQFRYTHIKTINCINNINLHTMYQFLSNSFIPYVISDPLAVKLLIITLFFTTNLQTINFEIIEYKQLEYIKRIQSSYTELLWLYVLEKYGEKQAINIFTKVIIKFIHLQATIAQIDSIVRLNNDIQYIDSLMKTILQLA